MSRALVLIVSMLGGALLGYGLLRVLLDFLAVAGGFSMVDGPSLPQWADSLIVAALIGAGLTCWAISTGLVWWALRRRMMLRKGRKEGL